MLAAATKEMALSLGRAARAAAQLIPSTWLTAAEFRQEASFRVDNLPGITSIMMIQRVDGADRSRYETFIGAQTGRAGAIRDMRTFRTVFLNISSEARPTYMPILYSLAPKEPEYEQVLQSLDAKTSA